VSEPDPENVYSYGATPTFASQYDQRFAYCLYVPPELENSRAEPRPLVVIQHGTDRSYDEYRDLYSDLGNRMQCVILTPLFPAHIESTSDLHNFKFLKYHSIRYDLVLIAMVEEVAQRYPIQSQRIYLHGFSGGGQFAHRFFMAHPDRLAAVSIGAPGRVTLIDDGQPWWLGTADFEAIFHRKIDIAAMADVPVQMVVGDQDTETWEINNVGGSNWMDGAEKTGRTRIERLNALRHNYESLGISVRLTVVPDVGHGGQLVVPYVADFLAEVMAGQEASPAR
jgi:poly(3-hydroxybutyrate) depolymerase